MRIKHELLLSLAVVLLSVIAAQSLQAGHRRTRRPSLDQCDSLFAVIITPDSGSIRLTWYDLPGVAEWVVYRAAIADFSDAEIAAVVTDSCTWRESDAIASQHPRGFYAITAHWDQGTPSNYEIIEDFELPVELESYSAGEDVDPLAWRQIQDGGINPYGFSLELFGNTWKRQYIDTMDITPGTVWQIVAKADVVGENQALGLADSANEMYYGLWGSQIRQRAAWNNTYQGWEPDSVWSFFNLPIGDDWFGRFGYYPAITSLIYSNDGDDSLGILRIDELRDISGTISLPPDVRFRWEIAGYPNPDSMDVAFCSMGCDPEGPIYRHLWSLGDGSISFLANPVHRYPAGQNFVVALTVRDTSNRVASVVHTISDSVSSSTRRITALFSGDVMMARRYEADGGIIPTQGVNAIFARIRPLVMSVDMATCNLECPLTLSTEHHPTKMFYFKGRPEYVGGLSFAGFDYCALANNHVFDYLETGQRDTEHALDSVSILHGGSGDNDEIARAPSFYSKNGLCVGILSFCNRDGSWDNEQPYLGAGPNRPGFAMWNRTAIEETIPSLRDVADVVVVHVHSGIEYAAEPPPALNGPSEDRAARDEVIFNVIPDTSDVDLRHYAIDMGADVVINHHPHVIQGCEIYNGKLIAHSMGNFAFDQQFPETFFSMAITADLSYPHTADHFVLHPTYIQGYIPGEARGELAGAILDYLSDLSRPMNTWIMRAPNADSARIFTARDRASCQTEIFNAVLPLTVRNDTAYSMPYRLTGGGYPSWISVDNTPAFQYRVGRELLWYGNMENEGATPWDLNSIYERYDSTTAYSGQRSLRLNRAGGGNNSVSTNLLYRWPYNSSGQFTLLGSMRGTNTRECRLEFRYWYWRSGGELIATQLIGPEFAGNFPWTEVWDNLVPPGGVGYFDVRLALRSPTLGEGFAWFDDIAMIQWEDWQSAASDLPFPSNISFVQVRAPSDSTAANVSYRTEWYYPMELEGGVDISR